MQVMTDKEMTLERSLGKNFFPHSIKECEEDYIGENNWKENEGEYDSDFERNRDLVNSILYSKSSPHPWRNYPKKKGKGWKNGEPDSEHIELMTKRFLEDGGKIRVIPRTFSSGMNSVGYKGKVWGTIKNGSHIKNRPFGEFYSNVWNHEWCEQFKYFENMERVEKSKKLCDNREFWTEKMIPLMKEESSDFESSCELEDRLDEVNEIGFRYPTSYQMNQ